ncbi:hypothetical protein Tco_0689166 [Tanacetum coccineum]
MFMHTSRDDSLLGTMRFVFRHEDTQVYGALLPEAMTNQAMLDSDSYKTYYAIASGAEPLKPKKSQMKSDSTISSEENHSKKKPAKGKKDIPSTKKPAIKPKPTKKKAPVKVDRGTGFNVLSEVALSEAAQLKEAIKRNKQDSHVSHANFESEVFDEQHRKIFGTDEGTDDDENDSEDESYDGDNDDDGNNEDDGDNYANDDDNQEDDDKNDEEEDTDSDRNESDRVKIHVLNQSSTEYYKEEEEKVDDEEKMDDEEDDEVTKELYKDVNVNLGNEDAEMTNANQGGADQHNKTDGTMQSSSVSFDFTSKLLNLDNPSPTDNEIASLMDTIIRHEEPSNHYIGNKLGEAINKSIQSHIVECREEALAEKKEYIDCIETSVRAIIKEEVSSQLPQILPQASSSQPQSTYAAATSFSEFKLTKILIEKMEEHKSYKSTDYKRELYDALVKSYNTDKDVFESYGMSKENKSSSTFKGTSHSQHKSFGKSALAEEPSHTVDDSGVQQNQEFDTGYNDEQPTNNAASKVDWFKKPERPPTPNPDWNKRQNINFRPPQTWTSQVARAEEPPTSFDELINTPIDFSAFFLNRLNIIDLTQAILVGPAFNLLKGTYKIRTELEYHFEEFFKATTERLDWHNPEGKQYPFDLCKHLPLILDFRGRQVIPQDYFINNDLEYLKVGSLSRKYSNSTTKTKAATYEIKWIKDMVPYLWITRLKIMKRYDYGHLDEIEVRREDQ